jgi:hypothetical protein
MAPFTGFRSAGPLQGVNSGSNLRGFHEVVSLGVSHVGGPIQGVPWGGPLRGSSERVP